MNLHSHIAQQISTTFNNVLHFLLILRYSHLKLMLVYLDRCRLQNPVSVEDIQDLLLTCLSYWFKKSRPDEPMIFAKIIDVLLQLRVVRHLHSKEEEKFAMLWSNKIQLPPLMYEMWSS